MIESASRRVGVDRYPRPRLDLIVAFGGPALYRELSLVDKTSFNAMKSARTLKESLGLAGWTSEVLESLGTGWVSTMAMMEEVWRMEQSFAVLSCKTWDLNEVMNFRVGPHLFNAYMSRLITTDAEIEFLESATTGELSLWLSVRRENGMLCSRWYLLYSVKSLLVDMRNAMHLIKVALCDNRTTLSDPSYRPR
jgi:hypothetical protein